MPDTITVRPFRRTDIALLADMEQAVWRPSNTPALTVQELVEWYDEQSPYFLVAEQAGTACGYFFGRQLHFSFARLSSFLDPSRATSKGFSRQAHDPTGTSVYGINIIGTLPGTGRALYAAVHSLLSRTRTEYYVGFSRLVGLNRYCKRIEESTGRPIRNMDAVALWYAHENMQRLGMRTWDECAPRPNLCLPDITRPDPVLAFHVRGTSFGLAGVLPEYMHDPASRNYGAFIVSDYPHRS